MNLENIFKHKKKHTEQSILVNFVISVKTLLSKTKKVDILKLNFI